MTKDSLDVTFRSDFSPGTSEFLQVRAYLKNLEQLQDAMKLEFSAEISQFKTRLKRRYAKIVALRCYRELVAFRSLQEETLAQTGSSLIEVLRAMIQELLGSNRAEIEAMFVERIRERVLMLDISSVSSVRVAPGMVDSVRKLFPGVEVLGDPEFTSLSIQIITKSGSSRFDLSENIEELLEFCKSLLRNYHVCI